MANLSQILAQAQGGEAIAAIGDKFDLTAQQTEAAIAAVLPAISLGLKQSTATPEGLAHLFSVMGRQPDLYAMYDDPRVAFSPQGVAAGNAALSAMFGTPDASRAIAGEAQHLSGLGSAILKKLLPIIAGLILSGLMRSGSGQATPVPRAPRAPEPQPEPSGGGLGDILREIFGQGQGPSSAGQRRPSSSPVPPITDILGPERKGASAPTPKTAPSGPRPAPAQAPADAGPGMPTDGGGEPIPGGDVLSQILRELQKGIEEGRIKPVTVGPYEADVPASGRGAPSTSPSQPQAPDQPQAPGGDILGQILRDILSGAGGKQAQAGSAVFGNLLEPGQKAAPDAIDSFQEVLDRFLGAPRR
jgi:hypothetical protein